jgi:pilus assembly protein CpaB
LSRRARVGILIALAGLGLAVIGFYALSNLIRRSLAPLPPPTPQAILTEKVVVATHDLLLGSVIRTGDVRTVEMPVGLIPAEALREPEEAIGRITKVPLTTGEIVMSHHLADPTNVNRDLAFIISDNQILIAFPATDLMSTLNVLQRGDLVDILVSVPLEVPVASQGSEGVTVQEGERVSRLFTFDALQRTEITALVVDILPREAGSVPSLPSGEGAPQPTPTPQQVKVKAYLLALTPQDALLLKHLKDMGAVFDFALRAPTSTQRFDLQPVTSDYLIDRYELAIPR